MVTIPTWAVHGPTQVQMGSAEPVTVQVSKDQP